LGLLIKYAEITDEMWTEWSMPGVEIKGLRNKVNAILYYALGEMRYVRGYLKQWKIGIVLNRKNEVV